MPLAPALSFPPELLLQAQGTGLGLKAAIFDVDGVLTDGRIYIGEQGEGFKAFSTLDGQGLKLLDQAGIVPIIITGRDSPAVRRRVADLGLKHAVYGAKDKLAVAQPLLDQLGLQWSEVAAMGDDWPDLPLMMRAGFACAPAHAHAEAKARGALRDPGRGRAWRGARMLRPDPDRLRPLHAVAERPSRHARRQPGRAALMATLAPPQAAAHPRPTVSWVWKLQSFIAGYLPLLLMAALAGGTWWLVKNTPAADALLEAPPPRHVPDYQMEGFSLERIGVDGLLRGRIEAARCATTPTPTPWRSTA